MRYRLRTLLIVLVLGPPILAGMWWGYGKWREALARKQAIIAAPRVPSRPMQGGMFTPPPHLPYWRGEGDPPPGYEKGNMGNESTGGPSGRPSANLDLRFDPNATPGFAACP